MSNYFIKQGNVIQMRPTVPVGFRRVVREEKAETAGRPDVSSPPGGAPDPGLPPPRRRSFRGFVLAIAFSWALVIALYSVTSWAWGAVFG